MNDIIIKGLSTDSRLVRPGDLFLAYTGATQDGRLYIQEALQKGAVAVLSEPVSSLKEVKISHSPPIIPFSDLRNALGPIASRFFNDPSKTLPIIGITGTNGKTSCSHFIAQLLTHCGKKTGIVGTLGRGYLSSLKSWDCTTPDAITLQKTIMDFQREQAFALVMEVSSHGLVQGRVQGVHFHTAIFTNLSQDHLDYHGTMEEYGTAKQKLFTELKPKHTIINFDDDFGQKLRWKCQNVIGYSINPRSKLARKERFPCLTIEQCQFSQNGVQAVLKTPWGVGNLQCALLGQFSLSNVLASIAAVCLQGVPLAEVLDACKALKNAEGRMMQMGGGGQEPLVVIDYAHTPHALEQVLKALKPYCKGQLWCIFGCGGDRDRGKRALMASVAEALSDKIILTEDNSRTENPDDIIQDILKGIKRPEDVHVEYDRASAIQYAIHSSKIEDVILVAGKGHETYQITGHQKIPFCDKQIVIKALQGRI